MEALPTSMGLEQIAIKVVVCIAAIVLSAHRPAFSVLVRCNACTPTNVPGHSMLCVVVLMKWRSMMVGWSVLVAPEFQGGT
jgi:hypothetical protein